MSDLPTGWEWTTLGEIAETSLGKMLDNGRSTGSHLVPYLRNVNVQWGTFDLSSVHKMDILPGQREAYAVASGDLLVCEGGEIGRCAIWSGSSYMAFQKALHRVRPRGGIEAHYLRYLLEYLSITRELLPYSSGSTIKHLPQVQLRRLAVPLPPTVEQRRIVAALEDHLSRLDAGVAMLGAGYDRLGTLRDRVLSALCTGGLACAVSGATAPLINAGVQDGTLPNLPADWRWARLGDVADVVGGVTKDAKRLSDPNLRAVPYLRVANVQRGRLDLSEVAMINVPDRTIAELALLPGDVLLNEGGDRDKLARGWIWEGQLPLCIHQNHVFRARVRDGILDPRILAWHANSFGQKWAEVNGKQSVNLASISLTKIRLMPVPVPPKPEQLRIVETIEENNAVVERMEKVIEASETRAAQLRRSLLTGAFAGRLVPQDPNDEPASALLERIRFERVAQPARRRNTRKQETLR